MDLRNNRRLSWLKTHFSLLVREEELFLQRIFSFRDCITGILDCSA